MRLSTRRFYYVYIILNRTQQAWYSGITADINATASNAGVSGVTSLLYLEVYSDTSAAIAREQEISRMSDRKKTALVRSKNPELRDITEQVS